MPFFLSQSRGFFSTRRKNQQTHDLGKWRRRENNGADRIELRGGNGYADYAAEGILSWNVHLGASGKCEQPLKEWERLSMFDVSDPYGVAM